MSKDGTTKFWSRLEQLIGTTLELDEITPAELIGNLEVMKMNIFNCHVKGKVEDEED